EYRGFHGYGDEAPADPAPAGVGPRALPGLPQRPGGRPLPGLGGLHRGGGARHDPRPAAGGALRSWRVVPVRRRTTGDGRTSGRPGLQGWGGRQAGGGRLHPRPRALGEGLRLRGRLPPAGPRLHGPQSAPRPCHQRSGERALGRRPRAARPSPRGRLRPERLVQGTVVQRVPVRDAARGVARAGRYARI
ncbi:MAG: Acetyltransferase, GNAT family, partial [uncultured Rubrobacteraceae bacterium]